MLWTVTFDIMTSTKMSVVKPVLHRDWVTCLLFSIWNYVKICCFFPIWLAFGKPQEYVNRLNFTANGEIYLGFRILWVRAFISSNNMWTLIKNVELFRYISVFNTTGFVQCQMMYYWSFLKFGFSIIFIEKISDSPRG